MKKRKKQSPKTGNRKKTTGKKGQKGPYKKRGGKPPLGFTRKMQDGAEGDGVRAEVFAQAEKGAPDEWAGLGLKPKQRALLDAYSLCGSLRKAAKAAGVARNNHGRWIEDEKYAEAFKAAKERASEALEDEARRRAVEGVEVPVYFKGKVRGYRRCCSDTLLIFLLKGNNPEKFGDRLDATHHVPEPIPVNVNLGAELMQKVLEAGGKPGVPGVGGKG